MKTREIKFRCWDAYHRTMSVPEEYHFYPDGSWVCYTGEKDKGKRTLMQYTGLNDKNGKEIYEKDICRYYSYELPDWAGRVKIRFKDGAFVCQKLDDDERIARWLRMEPQQEKYKTLEVIGNVYENPELLEQE